MDKKINPMTWESMGVVRDKSLKKSSHFENVLVEIIISFLGGLAGSVGALLLYFQLDVQVMFGVFFGRRGGHYDPVTGERLPQIFFNFTKEEICGTVLVGFLIGVIGTILFMLRTKRQQQEYERQYGGRREE